MTKGCSSRKFRKVTKPTEKKWQLYQPRLKKKWPRVQCWHFLAPFGPNIFTNLALSPSQNPATLRDIPVAPRPRAPRLRRDERRGGGNFKNWFRTLPGMHLGFLESSNTGASFLFNKLFCKLFCTCLNIVRNVTKLNRCSRLVSSSLSAIVGHCRRTGWPIKINQFSRQLSGNYSSGNDGGNWLGLESVRQH